MKLKTIGANHVPGKRRPSNSLLVSSLNYILCYTISPPIIQDAIFSSNAMSMSVVDKRNVEYIRDRWCNLTSCHASHKPGITECFLQLSKFSQFWSYRICNLCLTYNFNSIVITWSGSTIPIIWCKFGSPMNYEWEYFGLVWI